MRLATLVVGLWFTASQSTAVVDCCCGSFCLHKDACRGCKGGEMEEGSAHPSGGHGRCNSALSAHHSGGCAKDACSHIEPQGDVVSVQADHHFIPILILGFVPLIPLPPACGLLIPVHQTSRSPPHAEDPPLYLRYEVLLI